MQGTQSGPLLPYLKAAQAPRPAPPLQCYLALGAHSNWLLLFQTLTPYSTHSRCAKNICPSDVSVMGLGANSAPTGICKLGRGEEGQWIQCKQLGCDTAWLWNGTAVRPPTGRAARPGYTALLQGDVFFCCFKPGQWGLQFSLERESALSNPEGAPSPREQSLPLVPNWSVLMQMRAPNPHTLIGSTSTVLIGRNAAALTGPRRC